MAEFKCISTVILKKSPKRNCFITLPSEIVENILHTPVVSFIIEDESGRQVYVSWAGETCLEKPNFDGCSTVLLNEAFMLENNLADCGVVILKQVDVLPPLDEISVQIRTEVEWQNLTLNLDVARDQFLSQVRLVYNDEILPLWLPGGITVNLHVKSLNPDIRRGTLIFASSVKILSPETDIVKNVVISPSENTEASPEKNTTCHQYKCPKVPNHLMLTFNYVSNELTRLHKNASFPCPTDLNLILKVAKMPSNSEIQNGGSLANFVIISRQALQNSIYQHKSEILVRINPLHHKNTDKNDAKTDEGFLSIVLIWENFKNNTADARENSLMHEIDGIIQRNFIFIPDEVRLNYSLRLQSAVNLEVSSFKTKVQPLCLQVTPDQKLTSEAQSHLIGVIHAYYMNKSELSDFVLVNSFRQRFYCDWKYISVVINVERGVPLIVTKKSAPLLQIRILENQTSVKINFQNELDEEQKDIHSQVLRKSLQEMKDRIGNHLMRQVKWKELSQQHISFIVIEGNSDSGKSKLVKALTEKLSHPSCNVYCQVISCRERKGKKADSLTKHLNEVYSKALLKVPSFICLEDLDSLCPQLKKDNLNFDYQMQLVSSVRGFLDKIQKYNYSNRTQACITVAITCAGKQYVEDTLVSYEHSSYFGRTYTIPPMKIDEKFAILREILQDILNANIEESRPDILKVLEPYSLSDLKHLALRVVTNYNVQRRGGSASLITAEEVLFAAQGFIPMAHKDNSIKRSSSKSSFTKVGGLTSQIQLLVECISWPAQYPNLFNCVRNTNLRLLSGILLYGPPGCGKTRLVQHIAELADVSIVTVKGPELLSKFIGKSEENVRAVFERAANSSPCILFFDEFDSLAPPRGRDTTGVTDRVVNQLLSQMDGVESRGGNVWIIATTCRPDLIDPALLRPGRLEKLVYLPLPTESEREDILRVLSQQYEFCDTIDWRRIASNTGNMSGADLQAILSSARMNAVREVIGNSSLYSKVTDDVPEEGDEVTKFKGNKIETSISSLHVDEAVVQTKPSVSAAERKMYQQISLNFSGNANPPRAVPDQKVTFA